MNTGAFILIMLLYCIGGGVNLGMAIEYFKERKYIRFGISAMFALSTVLCMTYYIFIVGGM